MVKYKKVVSILLSLFCVFAILSGCGSSNKTNDTTSQKTTTSTAQTTNESNSAKVSDEKITLSQLTTLAPELDSIYKGDPNNSPIYKELEKRTNVHIEWIVTPDDDKDKKMMLLISSGSQPDLMYIPPTYPGGVTQAFEDGIIVDLASPEYSQFCPNYMKWLNSEAGWKREVTDDDGRIAKFATLYTADGTSTVCFGPMIREDFLAKVGLPVPETIDEWYQALKAFKDQNLCKSPLSAFNWALGYSQMFVGAYGTWTAGWDDTLILPNADDQLVFGPIQPTFKDFLATFKTWYKEGLIDPDYFNLTDWGQLDAKVTSGECGATIHFLSRLKVYNDSLSESGGSYVGTPYAVINKGDKPLYGQGNALIWQNACISAKSKYIKEAIKYLDYGYTEEGHILASFGIEGESYNMVDGKPKYSDFIMDCVKNPDGKNSEGLTLAQAYGMYNGGLTYTTYEDPEYFNAIRLVDDRTRGANILWKVPKITTALKSYSFNKQETEAIKKLPDIMVYTKEMINKFILGNEPLDKFDAFVKRCEEMGINDVIAAYSASYQRYKAR